MIPPLALSTRGGGESLQGRRRPTGIWLLTGFATTERATFFISASGSTLVQSRRFGEFLADNIVRFINLFTTYLLKVYSKKTHVSDQKYTG